MEREERRKKIKKQRYKQRSSIQKLALESVMKTNKCAPSFSIPDNTLTKKQAEVA